LPLGEMPANGLLIRSDIMISSFPLICQCQLSCDRNYYLLNSLIGIFWS
jgi:hypothetical protein